jgi:hypothetical protein
MVLTKNSLGETNAAPATPKNSLLVKSILKLL